MSLSKTKNTVPTSDQVREELLQVQFKYDMAKKLFENIFAKCEGNGRIQKSHILKCQPILEFYDKSCDMTEITVENAIQKNEDPELEAMLRARWEDKKIKNKCPECDETFNAPSHLVRHFQNNHTEGKVWQCKICSKGFFSLQIAKDHVHSDHLFDKQYVCKVCKQRFTNLHHLKRHEKSDHIFLKKTDDIFVRVDGKKKEITFRKWKKSDDIGQVTQLYLIIWKLDGEIMGISIDYTCFGNVYAAAQVLYDTNLHNISPEAVGGCSYTEQLRQSWDFDPNEVIPLGIYGYGDAVGDDLKFAIGRWTGAKCRLDPQKSVIRLQSVESDLKEKFEESFSKMDKATRKFIRTLGWGVKDSPPQKKQKVDRGNED